MRRRYSNRPTSRVQQGQVPCGASAEGGSPQASTAPCRGSGAGSTNPSPDQGEGPHVPCGASAEGGSPQASTAPCRGSGAGSTNPSPDQGEGPHVPCGASAEGGSP